MTEFLVRVTLWLSLIIQFVTGVVTLAGFATPVAPIDYVLNVILQMETVVQFIEFVFYGIATLGAPSLEVLAGRRQFDWFITTPTMLLSTALYFAQQAEPEDTRDVGEFLTKEFPYVAEIGVANTLMLACGQAQEVGALDLVSSTVIGFAGFLWSFLRLWSRQAARSPANNQLQAFFSGIWSIYGIAHLLPTIPKNLLQNVLDIIAKNFQGLFIQFKILEKQVRV